ncbi:DUF4394 domain-containing protein [Pseudooctadecabacter sp.]|uniref:DUF4394 domain-containing protein n=1 Tax=Pseudooctadecabacter sp. TaxID=1966338 RepID=UPI0035C830CF
MLMRLMTTTTALTLTAGIAAADGHASTMGYALANDGMTLVAMDSIAAPAEAQMFDLAQKVDAIAYRPVTGDLLGYTNGAIFKINPATGELTDLGATFADDAMIMDGATVAFDFNNAIDAVRAVATSGENLVYFPEGFGDMDDRANSVLRFTDLAYAEGDVNADVTPGVYANAYTNAIAGATAESTFQYALDYNANALISLANNAGTLETVAYLTVDGDTVDLSSMGGFDIVSPEVGTDAAYAILQMDGSETAGLYAIDLESGAATLLSDLGMGGITSFAVSMGM